MKKIYLLFLWISFGLLEAGYFLSFSDNFIVLPEYDLKQSSGLMRLNSFDPLIEKMTPLSPQYKKDQLLIHFKKFILNPVKLAGVKEEHEKYYSMKKLFRILEEERVFATMA